MNDDRSLERAARSWLEAGPTDAPDRAVEAALARVQTTSQERDLRIPWRLPKMNPLARLAIVGVIAVAAIGGALYVLKPSSSVGSPTIPPTPPASSAAPNRTVLPTNATRLDYSDLQGWIAFEHFGNAPDGSTTTFDADRRGIWLVHADGSGLHELAPGKPANGKTSLEISPDGTKVVFSTWKDVQQVWEAPIAGGDPVLLSKDCNGQADTCMEADPAYSPDGKRIAFVRITGSATAAIALRELATGKVTVLAATSVNLPEGWLAQPSWSSDGAYLSYDSLVQGSGDNPANSSIFVVGSDGSGVRQLATPPQVPAGDSDWAPDDSAIVFSTSPGQAGEDGTFTDLGIYTVAPDGSGLTRLCGPCDQGGVAPTWTSDGAHILYFGYRTWDLMDADGTHPLPINRAKLTWFGDAQGYGYVARIQPTP
jgi:Tol biopolymer transport system component